MNIIYGVLAFVISLYASKAFVQVSSNKSVVFVKSFALAAGLISVLGAFFFILKLGFFSQNLSGADAFVRIFGFAAFLGVLSAMKAINTMDQ